MPSVHFKSVSFQYSSALVVIANASFDLGPGWTGVVGANGGGKSTLLHLVSGDLVADSGSIRVEPTPPGAVLCPQEVGAIDNLIRSLADSLDGVGRRILGELRLEPGDLERWPTLSPGERKRWQIGAALAAEPAVLLLDEPTNHLDGAARMILTGALQRYRGVGMVVSHDRTFLNMLTTKTIRVDQGAVEVWNGDYETARESWEARSRELRESYEEAKAEQRKLERRVADQRRAVESKRAKHKRTLRQAGPKDHDARSVEAKGRHEAGAATAARRLQTTQSSAERAAEKVASFEMRREIGRSFFFDYEPAKRRRLLNYDGPLRAGPRLIAANVVVDLGREDRVWLQGPNGAGKTTLLAALRTTSTLPPDRLLYLPQELTRDAAARVLAEVAALPAGEKAQVFNLVAALGVAPDKLLVSALPSPGEARKLVMAKGMGTGAWCLLLDEPTNHLDLPSIERLEEAVAGYPGAVVLVTHDEEFATATTTTTWHLEDGRLTKPT
jgi:ATPase subunit of ABC transporter with duplicated ATPase domains